MGCRWAEMNDVCGGLIRLDPILQPAVADGQGDCQDTASKRAGPMPEMADSPFLCDP